MIDSLRKLLNNTYIAPTCDGVVKLKDGNSKASNVEIIGMPSESLVVNVTKNRGHNQTMLSDAKNFRKCCDYVIVASEKKFTAVYFIELKQSIHFDSEQLIEDACNQIIFSAPIFKYWESMVETHFTKPKQIKYYLVVITKQHPTKKRKQPIYLAGSAKRSFFHKQKKFNVFLSADIVPFSELK